MKGPLWLTLMALLVAFTFGLSFGMWQSGHEGWAIVIVLAGWAVASVLFVELVHARRRVGRR